MIESELARWYDPGDRGEEELRAVPTNALDQRASKQAMVGEDEALLLVDPELVTLGTPRFWGPEINVEEL